MSDVNVATLTDEELDKQLSDNQEGDQPAAEGAESGSQPTGTPSPDSSTEPVAGKPESDVGSEIAKLRAEFEALHSSYRGLQTEYGRQSQEVGALRAKVQPKAPVVEPTDEDFHTNPKEAIERLQAAKEEKQRLAHEESQGNLRRQIDEVRTTVHSAIPKFEDNLAGLSDLLAKEDGLPQDWLNAFKQNPYMVGTAGLYHMSKRLESRQALVAKDTEIATLKQQLADAKKAPGAMVDKINRGQRAFSAPTSKPAAGASAALGNLSQRDIADMSEEEIDRAIENLKSK
jgi:small-conductance mechanosensitive channel